MSQYQIKLSLTGQWHRRQHGTDQTVCDLPIDGSYLSRDWILDENLCIECFTKRERDTAEMLRIERDALDFVKADETANEFLNEEEDSTDEHEIPWEIIKDHD